MTEPLFDPEKVKRYDRRYDDCCMEQYPDGKWVEHDEYDNLLSLYRELLSTCESEPQPRP